MRKQSFGFAIKLYHASMELLQRLVEYHSFEFYKLDLQRLTPSQQYTIREFRTYTDDVTDIHRDLERERYCSRKKSICRFEHGLYFYALFDDRKIVATTWIHPEGERFIDEVGYAISTPRNSLWLRDIYVNPYYRGNHICANFIQCTAKQFHPAATIFYSDIESNNTRSINAHLHCGYQYVCGLKALHLFKGLMIRSRLSPACPDLQLTGYRADKKVCLTLNGYQRYREHNLA
jgi:RimJ/RimL family protein N-acetyltransferase